MSPAFDLGRYVEGIPLGRMVEMDEIAASIVYLASDYASYVTGVDLPVDGGWTAARFVRFANTPESTRLD
jgi:NAD(P)-dependent dehydrogenase (short-subunit alcohol dehydrogenase family)